MYHLYLKYDPNTNREIFYYIENFQIYNASDLKVIHVIKSSDEPDLIIPPFKINKINKHRSKIIVVIFSNGISSDVVVYQQAEDGKMVELTRKLDGYDEITEFKILEVPMYNENTNIISAMPLKNVVTPFIIS